MPNLTLDLSEPALASLGAQAHRHDRSLEDEARALLEEQLVEQRFWTWEPVRRNQPPEEPAAATADASAAADASIPPKFRRDLRRAVDILRRFGATEVHLFGSLAQGDTHRRSDVDVAVRGLPKKKFFKALGELIRSLDHPVDLIDLDGDSPFVSSLLKEGRLVRIG